MYYYLYKITNTVNDRFYVGVHKTKDMEDGYMGSGKIITQAMVKYGAENFQKQILETFDNEIDMMLRESEIVDEEFLKNELVYNLKSGGIGGFDYINKSGISKTPEAINKAKLSLKEYYSKIPLNKRRKTFLGKSHTKETKELLSQKRKDFFENGGKHPKGMLGKHHKDETKQRQRDASVENSPLRGKAGLDHPTGGKTWYNNGNDHIRSFTPPAGDNWVKGRIFQKRNKMKKDRNEKSIKV